ncbi:T9SS type A sorting domain-containing protein [Aestuariibaculum sp. M13]|uniref:T9SS type A sorting domain-containing protein n=1 Tax=Aestuariibaculum sp. M13 TaxID=2967132 RepID=UPI002159D46E|nr:T9SS type A sorting domain-containing protein [Aestuariibaculum sp. M13]MCR8669363.1 T9SS type A sorting domain-containing protein [Aestuariibaculum sp. M13]
MIKNYTYFLLMFCNLIYAQLSVRNDYYVFAKDEVIFVTKDINLNETESKIYLRDEAQIIQGDENERNSGEGELSLYQEGNVDAYEYNYWCSPIGETNNSSDNNKFGISLLNDVVSLTESVPATYVHKSNYNGTSNPLNIEPYWIWRYIAKDNYYGWSHVQGKTIINPGEGFTMKGTSGSNNAQQYDFRGKPNTGTIGVTVEHDKYTLAGNPYPSALDAVAYIHDSENKNTIDGTLRFWEQNPNVNSHNLRDYQGGYASYTISSDGALITFTPATFNTYNGDGTINSFSDFTATKSLMNFRYIPIGQGFMVKGTASGYVKAKNSHRAFKKENTVADSTKFFKTTNTKQRAEVISEFSKIPNDYKRFRLNIDFNNQYTRQLVETFHHSATQGFDYGLETTTSIGGSLKSDAYWKTEDLAFLAQALNYDDTMKIPLGIKIANTMSLRIRITDIQNIEDTTPIYVHDKLTNTYIDLKQQDFNINIEKGNYTDRFEIAFTKNTLDLNSEIFKTHDVFQNNTIAQLKIKNPNNLDISQFQLFDVSGKQVINSVINNINSSYTYSTKALSNGVYIVKITSNGNQVFSKKILINNPK